MFISCRGHRDPDHGPALTVIMPQALILSKTKPCKHMLNKKQYANGQKVYDLEGNQLTYYYKHGGLKARGPFVDGQMEGEWTFWRENGQFWQVGHFKNNMKHGSFVRYDREGKVEYQEEFQENKVIRK